MLRSTLKIAIPLAMVLFAALSPAVQAHHSNANYDAKVEKSMKGTVVDYDWGNPHVLVIWDVKDPGGKTVRWTGDLASVESEQADGLTRHTLKPGDEVIMTVHPAKDGTPYANIIQIRRGDGTMILAVRSQGPKPASAGK
jgi:hypothetical protein